MPQKQKPCNFIFFFNLSSLEYLQMIYQREAEKLANLIFLEEKDRIVDYLIYLGDGGIFIPVLVQFVKTAKDKKNSNEIEKLKEYINLAYTPSLRAHVLDDFIRNKTQIQYDINEIKAKNGLYVLEQKLFMYKQAEEMLRVPSNTTGATHAIMKIIEFRGDKIITEEDLQED